jgi:hypothetical protein
VNGAQPHAKRADPEIGQDVTPEAKTSTGAGISRRPTFFDENSYEVGSVSRAEPSGICVEKQSVQGRHASVGLLRA